MSDLISVIIPAYRTNECHLRQAIESVLAQTHQCFELLIVDDCPEHPVVDIVQSYNDDRIKYLPNSVNCGMAESRNIGIAKAAGQYLALLDHDDVFKLDKLAIMVDFICQNPQCALVYTLVDFSNGEKQQPYSRNTLGAMLKRSDIHSCSTVMFRHEVVKKHDLRFNRRFEPADDYAFYLHILRFGKICQLPENLTIYRRHDGNYSNNDHRVHVALARVYSAFPSQIPLWNAYGYWNYLRSYSWVMRELGLYYLAHNRRQTGINCIKFARKLGWFKLMNWVRVIK